MAQSKDKNNYRNKSKGRKFQNKGKGNQTNYRADNNMDQQGVDLKHSNDPAWYAMNPQLLSDAASFPYAWPSGTKLDLLNEYSKNNNVWSTTSKVVSELSNYSVPGIMTGIVVPTVGRSVNATSPVNIAARNIYSFVRHANSGHTNYDSPDLMLYLLAMDSVYTFLSWCRRIYGIMSLYSPVNRYLPEALISAQGVNFKSVMDDLANFRYRLNLAIKKVGSFVVPASMSYMARHQQMVSGLYYDGKSPKAQIYQYTLGYVYKYVETAANQAGYLDATYVYSSPGALTAQNIYDIMDSLIDPISASEDCGIMGGDIYKAFGDAGVVKLDWTLDNYSVVPEYNEEMLSQFQNSTVTGPIYRVPGFDSSQPPANNVTQSENGEIISDLQFSGLEDNSVLSPSRASGLLCSDRVITFNKDVVTPADTMVGTRLTVCSSKFIDADPSDSTEEALYQVNVYGSEIMTACTLTRFVFEGGKWQYTTDASFRYDMSYDNTEASAFCELMQAFALASQFKWHPAFIYTCPSSRNSTTGLFENYQYGGLNLDIDNFTVLSYGDVEKLHETALLSQFNVPMMGAYARNVR